VLPRKSEPMIEKPLGGVRMDARSSCMEHPFNGMSLRFLRLIGLWPDAVARAPAAHNAVGRSRDLGRTTHAVRLGRRIPERFAGISIAQT
jgi:hypothetical protein